MNPERTQRYEVRVLKSNEALWWVRLGAYHIDRMEYGDDIERWGIYPGMGCIDVQVKRAAHFRAPWRVDTFHAPPDYLLPCMGWSARRPEPLVEAVRKVLEARAAALLLGAPHG